MCARAAVDTGCRRVLCRAHLLPPTCAGGSILRTSAPVPCHARANASSETASFHVKRGSVLQRDAHTGFTDQRASTPEQESGRQPRHSRVLVEEVGHRAAWGLTRRTTVRVPIAQTPHPPQNDLGLGRHLPPRRGPARRLRRGPPHAPDGRAHTAGPIQCSGGALPGRGDELTARGLVRKGARLSASRRASEGRVSSNQEARDSSTIARRRDAPRGEHRDDPPLPRHADANRPPQPITHPSSSRESRSSQRMSHVASR